MVELKDYLIVAGQIITLSTVIWSVIKIVNRNQREWESREQRLLNLEKELNAFRDIPATLAALGTKITELSAEMERVRNRLDRFLDTQSESRK